MMENWFRRRNKGRRILDEVRRFDTLIGADARLEGMIEGGDNCIVNGAVKGDCRLRGVLVLGPQGTWEGNIRAVDAVIAGTVEGDITVERKLELTGTARIHGCISGPAIAIATGAVHEGEIHARGEGGVVRFKDRRRDPEASGRQVQDDAAGSRR